MDLLNEAAATRLTTGEFHEAVYALEPRVAVFDCDGTLWSGDAGSGFMRWSIETGLVSEEMTELDRGAISGLRARRRERGGDLRGDGGRCTRACARARLREAARTYFARARRAEYLSLRCGELVGRLQERGVEIWAVSSTNDWVIEEGVRRFGDRRGRMCWRRGWRWRRRRGGPTRILDVPTDEGKVTALAAWQVWSGRMRGVWELRA